MKRILSFIALVVSLSIGAFAQEDEKQPSYFNGLYLGTGYGVADGSEFVPLYIGYRGQVSDKLVVGLEGLLGIAEASGASSEEFFRIADGISSATLKLGYLPDDLSLLYVGAGIGSVDFDSRDPDLDNSQVTATAVVGAERLLTPWIGVRAEAFFEARDSTTFVYGSIFLNF